MASDGNFLLSVLRRELANWMLRHDPDRYLQTYRKAHEVANAISARENSERRAELAKLTDQYKFYTDFDLVNTREYVQYSDSLGTYTYDEIESQYINIIRFQALKAGIHKYWSEIVHTTSDSELTLLHEYVERFKYTKFKNISDIRHALDLAKGITRVHGDDFHLAFLMADSALDRIELFGTSH